MIKKARNRPSLKVKDFFLLKVFFSTFFSVLTTYSPGRIFTPGLKTFSEKQFPESHE